MRIGNILNGRYTKENMKKNGSFAENSREEGCE
jgi:hypothetical protein